MANHPWMNFSFEYRSRRPSHIVLFGTFTSLTSPVPIYIVTSLLYIQVPKLYCSLAARAAWSRSWRAKTTRTITSCMANADYMAGRERVPMTNVVTSYHPCDHTMLGDPASSLCACSSESITRTLHDWLLPHPHMHTIFSMLACIHVQPRLVISGGQYCLVSWLIVGPVDRSPYRPTKPAES